jgi:hypothetical protein
MAWSLAPPGSIFPDKVEKLVRDKTRSLVLHHNDPKEFSFTSLDISLLPYPGVHSIWLHTHGGLEARVALTPAARALFDRGNADRLSEQIEKLVGDIHRAIAPARNQAIQAKTISYEAAEILLPHLAIEALRRGGGVAYHTSNTHRAEIEKLQLDPALDILGSEIRSSTFHGFRDDRRTGPTRHVGEAGTTLRQRPQAPGRRAE